MSKKIKVKKLSKEITKEEKLILPGKTLKKIQDYQNFMNDSSLQLGALTLQYEQTKTNFINEINSKQSKFNELMNDLQEEYGKVNIELSTGVLTPIENTDPK